MAPWIWKPVSPDSKDGKAGVKTGLRDFVFVHFKFLGFALAEGLIGGHLIEIVPDGLGVGRC